MKNEELWYFVYDLIDRENRTRREGEEITQMTEAAYEKLLRHDYPGNMRELEGIVANAVRKAREAGRHRIKRSDVEFEASTLLGVDVVAAWIRDGENRVLLRWSSGWGKWFYPARTVGGERVAKCLEEELREKFEVGADDIERAEIVKPDDRFETSRRDVPAFRLIQYSRRDRKTKYYYYYLYEVILKAERLEELRRRLAAWGDCKWASDDDLRAGRIADASETIRGLLEQLPPAAGRD